MSNTPTHATRQKNAMLTAGFQRREAATIRIGDLLYDGTRADLAFAVPVVQLRTWRNGAIQITCGHRDGVQIAFTYDPDELLWCAPISEEKTA